MERNSSYDTLTGGIKEILRRSRDVIAYMAHWFSPSVFIAAQPRPSNKRLELPFPYLDIANLVDKMKYGVVIDGLLS